ncbi:unnamed protein product [Lepidochelys kempii]
MRSDTLPKAQITIKGEQIEEVEQYVCLGQEINMRHDQEGELSQRKKAGWCAFTSIKDVLQGKINQATRASLFNSTVLPAMLYSSKTWALTKTGEQQLSVTERAMERRILGISIRDRVLNEAIRQQSGVQDVVVESRHSKMRWAGHIARLTDHQWTAASVSPTFFWPTLVIGVSWSGSQTTLERPAPSRATESFIKFHKNIHKPNFQSRWAQQAGTLALVSRCWCSFRSLV